MTCSSMLVRHGQDEQLPPDENGHSQHTIPNVYREMLLQITCDFPGLPDVRTMTMSEIRFFYDAVRGELRRHTKPKD
jgi:hypothetical protein